MMKVLRYIPALVCLLASSCHCADMLQALSKTSQTNFLSEQSAQQCLKFQCATDTRLEGMDICYKADHLQENFGIVHLKDCQEGKMCHGRLNRCMYDPYNVYEGKLPGQSCQHNFQCLSGSCVEGSEFTVCAGLPESTKC